MEKAYASTTAGVVATARYARVVQFVLTEPRSTIAGRVEVRVCVSMESDTNANIAGAKRFASTGCKNDIAGTVRGRRTARSMDVSLITAFLVGVKGFVSIKEIGTSASIVAERKRENRAFTGTRKVGARDAASQQGPRCANTVSIKEVWFSVVSTIVLSCSVTSLDVTGNRKMYCKACGGASICKHQMERKRCKACGG